jgi:hypothetical protein
MIARCGSLAITFTVNLRGKGLVFRLLSKSNTQEIVSRYGILVSRNPVRRRGIRTKLIPPKIPITTE